MKNLMVIVAVSFAAASLVGCAGVGKGIGKGKGKGPVVIEEPAPVIVQDTYVTKG